MYWRDNGELDEAVLSGNESGISVELNPSQ